MISVEELDIGDVVYAAKTLTNDGSVPGLEDNAVVALEGARGVIVKKGHLEEDEDRSVFLVRFEDAEKNLGNPIGCWVEELKAEAVSE